MAKILYISDFDISGSGYMNISVPLCRGLSEKGHEIIALGLGYKSNEHHFPFRLIPMKTFIEVGAAVHNLRLLWKPDLIIASLDIPWHDLILRQVIRDQPTLPYFGIFPVEGDPLCMDWAMVLMQMTKQYVISQFGTEECIKQGVPAEHFQVGIDTVAWRPPTPDEKKALRDAAGFEETDRIVLTIADNQERKALGIALQSIAEARKVIPNLKYALVTRENNPSGFRLRSLASRDDIAVHDIFYIFERGMDFKKLWSMYAIADAFFLPSKAEGLGMCLLEAMACFPEDMEIKAEDVIRGMSKKYTGDLICIETSQGVIKVTPEHPFWTADGWQYAVSLVQGCLILYNPLNSKIKGEINAKEGISSIYQGRIGNIVNSISNNASKGSSKEDGEVFWVGNDSKEKIGFIQENSTKCTFSFFKSFFRGFSLYSWNNRWRRDCNYTNIGREKSKTLETHNSNFQYLKSTIRLAKRKIKFSFHLGILEWVQRTSRSWLYLLHLWNLSPRLISETSSISSHKKEANGITYRVLPVENESVTNRPIYRIPDEYYLTGEGVKFEAIRKIWHEPVKDLIVYNLSTKSGCYTVKGFVVHNCGVPCVATDCSGMKELLSEDRGFLIHPEFVYPDVFGNANRYMVAPWRAAEKLGLALGQSVPVAVSVQNRVDSARKYVEARSWHIPIDMIDKAISETIK